MTEPSYAHLFVHLAAFSFSLLACAALHPRSMKSAPSVDMERCTSTPCSSGPSTKVPPSSTSVSNARTSVRSPPSPPPHLSSCYLGRICAIVLLAHVGLISSFFFFIFFSPPPDTSSLKTTELRGGDSPHSRLVSPSLHFVFSLSAIPFLQTRSYLFHIPHSVLVCVGVVHSPTRHACGESPSLDDDDDDDAGADDDHPLKPGLYLAASFC